VYTIYFLELVQSVCAAADTSYWFGSGFGNMNQLNGVFVSPFDIAVIGSLVALAVQLFFCYRIWVLRVKHQTVVYAIICGLIAAVSIMQLVGGFRGAVASFVGKTFAVTEESHLTLVCETIWLFGEAFADVLIAVTMTFLLLRSNPETEGYARFPNVAQQIVRMIVQTNTLTACTAVTALVLRMGFPGKVYVVLPTFILGKLYSNTLLATFNHRIYLRNSHSTVSSTNSGSTLRDHNNGRSMFRGPTPKTQFNTTQEKPVDEESGAVVHVDTYGPYRYPEPPTEYGTKASGQ